MEKIPPHGRNFWQSEKKGAIFGLSQAGWGAALPLTPDQVFLRPVSKISASINARIWGRIRR